MVLSIADPYRNLCSWYSAEVAKLLAHNFCILATMTNASASKKSSRWDLLGCSLSGHETYRPIGSSRADKLAAKLSLETAQGTAWRCLRCGTYVVGAPSITRPLAQAPLVLRGKVLKQTYLLRVLAVERGIRGILLALLGLAILHFKSQQGGPAGAATKRFTRATVGSP